MSGVVGPQLLSTQELSTLGLTDVNFALVPNNDNVSLMSNALIFGFDVYSKDVNAKLSVAAQRIESYVVSTPVGGPVWCRDTGTSRNLMLKDVNTIGAAASISQHTASFDSPLVIRYPEPVECRKLYTGSNNHFFNLKIRRLDLDSSSNIYVNLYYTEF